MQDYTIALVIIFCVLLVWYYSMYSRNTSPVIVDNNMNNNINNNMNEIPYNPGPFYNDVTNFEGPQDIVPYMPDGVPDGIPINYNHVHHNRHRWHRWPRRFMARPRHRSMGWRRHR